MTLRIRRGTDQQRAGVTFDLGELAWTTDTKKLYVGDASTAGGINIAYNLAGTGLLWDVGTQKIKLGELNLSDLADIHIDAPLETGDSIRWSGTGWFPTHTSMIYDTEPLLGANLGLNNYDITGVGNIDITGSIDITSSLSVGTTLSVTTGLGANLSLNGNDITGIGDINITGDIKNGNLSITPNKIGLDTSTTGIEFANPTGSLEQVIVTGGATPYYGAQPVSTFVIQGHRGTREAPTATQPDDFFGRLLFKGRATNGTYKQGPVLVAKWTDDAVVDSGNSPTSDLLIFTGKGNNDYSTFVFTANGVFYAAKFYVGGFAETPVLPPQYPGTFYYNTNTKALDMWDGIGHVPLGGNGITLKTTSPTIASATTIAPTAKITFVSGTTPIDTITPQYPLTVGSGQIVLIPTDAWSTTASGNIALATTAVVNKALTMTYDAGTAKWYPSY